MVLNSLRALSRNWRVWQSERNLVKATVVDGKTHVHLDIDADLEKDELTKVLKSIGL